MNDPEKVRCQEYSRFLFGKSLKGVDLEDLMKGSSSFEEFRIRVVHKFASKNDNSRKIKIRWGNSVTHTNESPDANSLLHMLESLSQKQTQLEQKMRGANAELLEKLAVLDAAATAQATWRTKLEEIRYQIAEIRKRLEHLEELPSHRGNGSK